MYLDVSTNKNQYFQKLNKILTAIYKIITTKNQVLNTLSNDRIDIKITKKIFMTNVINFIIVKMHFRDIVIERKKRNYAIKTRRVKSNL